MLHTNASQVAALDIGYSSTIEEIKEQQPKILFLLGADDANIKKEDFPNTFIIYIGMYITILKTLYISTISCIYILLMFQYHVTYHFYL